MHRTRVALLASLFIALTVAAGQALAGIPNVELVTFLVFVAGYLLGPRFGALVGAVAIGAHSMFNVMGAAVPPMLVAQVASYAVIGAAGGILAPALLRARPPLLGAALLSVAGALLVLLYQLAVNIAAFYTFTGNAGLWAYIWGGIVFSAIQIVWNAVLFLLSMRPTLAVLRRYREELQSSVPAGAR